MEGGSGGREWREGVEGGSEVGKEGEREGGSGGREWREGVETHKLLCSEENTR